MPSDFQISLGAVSLWPVSVVRYLGVLFDSQRTFNQHINRAADKAIKTAGSLSRRLANLRGPRMFVRKEYYAILESIILYTAPIWAHSIQNANAAAFLRRVQRIGLSKVSCIYQSVSLVALCVLGRAPSLSLNVKERTLIYETTQQIWHAGTTRATAERLVDQETFAIWKAQQKEAAAEATIVEW